MEIFQLTEVLFEAATDARKRGCEEISRDIGGYLLSWTLKGGRYITGWGVLERGLCACAAFALMGLLSDVDAFKDEIHARLQDDRAPEQDVRERAARGISERAESLPVRGHWSSRIEAAVAQSDYATLAPLLNEIANILSPPAQ